jgi:N-acetylgalactosamine-N,N'-diacetylbacillosaminyl-diphospho-undecaprenol 4-alpha-N-acetylgalactosaminyltransferase
MTAQSHDFSRSDALKHRKRVLFVINSLTGGGAERVMATLLANSKAWLDRYEIALAVLDDVPRAFDMPEWLRIFQLDCKGSILSSMTALERVVRNYDPDVALSFLTRANFAIAIPMMKRNRPWIISERTSAPAHLGSAFRQLTTKALMRCIYPRATHVIAVSGGVADKLSAGFAVAPAKIAVIPNPVDSDALHAAAAKHNELGLDEPYVIAVGRLVSVKSYQLLIRGFAKAELPCRLVIAGDGPERDSLRALADELGIGDRVVMPGWLSNPYPALKNASAFALSSNVEGFPNALVEALAFGVPSVATNCKDGPAEILAGSSVEAIRGLTVAEAGILAPVGDVDSYAEALKLAFDESLRCRMIAAGRDRACAYSAATIVSRYWDVIESTLLLQARARNAG